MNTVFGFVVALPKRNRCAANHDLLLRMDQSGWALSRMARVISTHKRHVKKYLRAQGVTREFLNSNAASLSAHWKGGSRIGKSGYREIYYPGHPHRRKNNHYILEHRLVMEMKIRRHLLPEEVVHHMDRDKLNNEPSNLRLFSCNSEHLAYELHGKCPNWSEDGKRRILAAERVTPKVRESLQKGHLQWRASQRAGIQFVSKHDERRSQQKIHHSKLSQQVEAQNP